MLYSYVTHATSIYLRGSGLENHRHPLFGHWFIIIACINGHAIVQDFLSSQKNLLQRMQSIAPADINDVH